MTNQIPPPQPSVTPAGWYPDPVSPASYRWWDGTAWTDRVQAVQDAPPSLIPPPPAPAPSAYGATPSSGPGTVPSGSNGFAVWALVLGILGLLTFLVPFIGFAFGVAALVLGIVGLRAARRGASGRGLAVAGTTVGGVATLTGLLVMLAFMSFVAVGDASPSDPGSSVAPSEAAAPVETDEADASEDSEVPASAEVDPRFVQLSRNDLDDIDKDLNDMIVTLDEGGTWRLLSNSVELTFNHAQLETRTPPESIASEWNAQLPILEGIFTDMDAAITDDEYAELRELIASAQAQVETLRGVLDGATP